MCSITVEWLRCRTVLPSCPLRSVAPLASPIFQQVGFTERSSFLRTLKLQFSFLECMGKAMPKVMLELTPSFSQPSHRVSLIFTRGCSEAQVCRCRAGIFSPRIRCGCLPHPSLGDHQLFSQVRKMLWSQGREHPQGGGSAGSPQPGWERHQRALDKVLSSHQRKRSFL